MTAASNKTGSPKAKRNERHMRKRSGRMGSPYSALEAPETPKGLRELPVIETLRLTWQRHYEQASEPSGLQRVQLRAEKDLPPAAAALESPYDTDARFRTKRNTQWTGYMVHFTETCEPETVNLLTHVVTTSASVHEVKCTADIHPALVDKQLPPGDHLVDAAYINADLLVSSQRDHAIRLVGPPPPRYGVASQRAGRVHARPVYD